MTEDRARIPSKNFIIDAKRLTIGKRYLGDENIQEHLARNRVQIFEDSFDVLKLLNRAVNDQRVGRRVRHYSKLLLLLLRLGGRASTPGGCGGADCGTITVGGTTCPGTGTAA